MIGKLKVVVQQTIFKIHFLYNKFYNFVEVNGSTTSK
jgi:hypothetical protein